MRWPKQTGVCRHCSFAREHAALATGVRIHHSLVPLGNEGQRAACVVSFASPFGLLHRKETFMESFDTLHAPVDHDLSAQEELSLEQLDDVNGGILPVVAAFAAGMAIGWLARGQ